MNDRNEKAPPPPSADFPHHAAELIRLGDHDHQNHVNNAVYLTYLETGRVTFMREVFGGLRFGDKNFVVARVEINYLHELQWPGTLDVCTGVERIGTSSVSYAQAIFSGERAAARGRTVMVFTDRTTGRSTPIPEDLRARLEAMRMRNAAA